MTTMLRKSSQTGKGPNARFNHPSGVADEQGPDAHFNQPGGLALDAEENLLVADVGNNASSFFDIVDGEGVIVVSDRDNHRLRKIVGGQVTTLAGSSEPGTADGAGAVARFNQPYSVALDERGRLLVAERGREDTL